MDSITVKAYAKINLGLDVLRKREDGYHDVCMIMQSIKLCDTITIRREAAEGIRIRTNLPYLPDNQDNLVYKAAALLQQTLGIRDGLSIELEKKIPVAAGLAGGSSNAAATLLALNRLYQAGLPKSELRQLGVRLGADVPYCVMLGTALSEGIGEVLTPLPSMPSCSILLVKPDISVSTRYVYENLNLTEDSAHPDIEAMKIALSRSDLYALTRAMDNILQSVTVKEYPIIADIKDKMKELGALTSLMSGSGPTVFGIYQNQNFARKALNYFRKHRHYGKQVYLTTPYWP
ncbi:4-diphosphocytidyl-2-C-methyl-D-erythritol kinase [Anaerotaenia torta]|uniref:4-(cytidine 5'-diphospho)-2-C-methyl-D-erythritol kinase n=1 Tax=Anaerotaenia torta TaxID=433293 RepID=UPI003D1E9415